MFTIFEFGSSADCKQDLGEENTTHFVDVILLIRFVETLRIARCLFCQRYRPFKAAAQRISQYVMGHEDEDFPILWEISPPLEVTAASLPSGLLSALTQVT